MRVIITAPNVSQRMSGESVLPVYYFNRLRARGVQVWVVTHARCREEVRSLFPNDDDFQKFYFIEDTRSQVLTYQVSHAFPYRIQDLIFGQMLHLLTQRHARTLVQQLVKEHEIDLVFEPTPITPKGLSCMYDLGVPVVIGPMCGGLEFPPAFRYMDSLMTRLSIRVGRALAQIGHLLVPGKLQAKALIVGNDLTAAALPKGYGGKVYRVEESGVDLSLCQSVTQTDQAPNDPVRFVFFARFVDWKGVQFLVEAFKQVAPKTNAVLELIGDGMLLEATKAQVAALGLQDKVNFHGRLTLDDSIKLISSCQVYVVPSLRECGGNAILEVMAMGLPLIATNWAGPGLFVNDSCGILVEPSSRQGFVDGLAEAMLRLAASPELRHKLGQGSAKRVTESYFDWDSKTDRILEIMRETLQQTEQSVATTNRLQQLEERSTLSAKK
ncbi:MAG: glycosyltransferase family 4 protein [Stenomitos frigidus ULC029]